MLDTEKVNEKSKHIGEMDTLEAIRLIQEENYNAVRSLDPELPQIAAVIDETAARMKDGGRLFYMGCGTSGRIGVLDASECPPTFGVSPDTVIGIMAGGVKALYSAVEGVEDSADEGIEAVSRYRLTDRDTLIGISAAGGAEFVIGGLKKAKEAGAYTVALSSNHNAAIRDIADAAIITQTGAEVIAGSTRLKAGTAQKLVLNMISTGVMIRLGYVYQNRMINLKPVNKKLKRRMIGIVTDILGVDDETAERLLTEHHYEIASVIKAYKENGKP